VESILGTGIKKELKTGNHLIDHHIPFCFEGKLLGTWPSVDFLDLQGLGDNHQ
jgi:hypothetical protein